MKNLKRILVLTLVMVLLVPSFAFADAVVPEDEGICNVAVESTYSSTVTVTPDQSAASGSFVDLEGNAMTNFYPKAVKVAVDYTGATSGKQYLVFMTNTAAAPTKSNLLYINQDGAGASGVEFTTVYPDTAKLESGATYYIYLSGSDLSYTKVASLDYFVPYMLGDVDLNKSVQPVDAMYTLQHTAGIIALTGSALKAADVDKNGAIQPVDAMYILQYTAGIITDFDSL